MKTPFPTRRASWLIFGALMTLLLLLAWTRPLALPDEGRYGEIGRWMLQSGDYLAPRLNGLPFFHKPPLLHWLQSVVFSLLGVSAWSARIVPALHAGLMVLGLYLAMRRVEGEIRARQAMLILGSSLGFLIGDHIPTGRLKAGGQGRFFAEIPGQVNDDQLGALLPQVIKDRERGVATAIVDDKDFESVGQASQCAAQCRQKDGKCCGLVISRDHARDAHIKG